MGNATSNQTKGSDDGVAQALIRCEKTLGLLKHSISTLTRKEADHWAEASAARKRRDNMTAASMTRSAIQAARDLKAVRARHAAIERQKSMIQQQQLNMLLTGVLVETSKVLRSTQSQMEGATSAVDESADVYHDIFDQMSEIGESMAATEGDEHMTEEDELLAQLDARMNPPPQGGAEAIALDNAPPVPAVVVPSVPVPVPVPAAPPVYAAPEPRRPEKRAAATLY